jgi:Ser/Thr protein kinase RdoA (MazF antagonist)
VAELRIADLPRIGAGREAEVYGLDDGRVLRLARTAALGSEVERERVALLAARSCGVPVPAVFELLDVDGRPGLVLERLEARDLLSGMLERPWEIAVVPQVLATLHVSLHERAGAAELPELHAQLTARLRSPLVPPDLQGAARRALQRLRHDDRLCHGDFHPGNVLRRREGGYAVIDWKGAARGDPCADIARTRLLMHGAWIPGLPRWLQQLLRPLRRALYSAYLVAYKRQRAVERANVGAWLPVLAAARLCEDIPEERTWLLDLARRGLR